MNQFFYTILLRNELITNFPKSDKNEKFGISILLYKYDD